MFPAENNFLQLLALAKDQKQKKNIIRFINRSQLKVVKNIAQKILNRDIHFKKKGISYFEEQETFFKEIIPRKNKNYRFT